MKKQMILAGLLALISLPAFASNTPKEALEDRVGLIERFLNDGDVNDSFIAYTRQLDERVKELERKVAGMQKQITVLHGKKADK
ncbi:MAG: hypothetical protein K2Y22_04275 [Candidatus Obscuribacterales bacterium]|nr:hypothetical protein [Candidatus Obscuribacterales bacterium]